MSVRFEVNGKDVEIEVEPRLTLADCLRHHLRLTGTHVGCEHGVCGACTILMDGHSTRSCLMLAVQADGHEFLTVEGIAPSTDQLHPLQEAFRDNHGLQCGFCTPGMVMSAIDLVQRHPDADEKTIRAELEGNLCRCTGYQNIVKAVAQGAAAMRR